MRRRGRGGRSMVERRRSSKVLAAVAAGSVGFLLILYQYVGPGLSLAGAPGALLLRSGGSSSGGGGGGGTGGHSGPGFPDGGAGGGEPSDLFPTPDPHYVKKYYFPVRELERRLAFDMKGEDVIVFLHIQKTGGTTFGRHLVQNVRLEVPCDCRPGQKKCTCYRPNRRETWLFSRFSTGWSCGLHADWTELTSCVPGVLGRRRGDPPPPQPPPQPPPAPDAPDAPEASAAAAPAARNPRKFYYITLLRDPVSRYLSEWRHVQRGATWKTSLHMCDGRTPTPEELPSCYEGTDWSGCTLQEFMDCPYNLANNRQVRMLADLSLVGCYNMSFIPENKRAQILLESAKKNLRDMAFFGLTEFQRKTQYLFERTFNLKFIRPFMQYNSTRAGGVEVDNNTIRRIEELNDLDMQLYDYAKDLFQQRYQYKRQLERMEQRIKNREERLLHRSNEALPKEETEEQGRLPTEDYMSHIIEKW